MATSKENLDFKYVRNSLSEFWLECSEMAKNDLGQATKGFRWMPRYREAMKDVEQLR
jgi:hypothetical protein